MTLCAAAIFLSACVDVRAAGRDVFETASALPAFSNTAAFTPLPPTLTATSAPTSTPTPVPPTPRPPNLTKFEPPDGQILVFIGQDNASVGGNGDYRDGYIEHVGVPAGITTYVYMVENQTNKFGFTFDSGHVDGLLTEENWGAGPLCAQCYLDSPELTNTILHISISMDSSSEYLIANGTYDYLVDELAGFLGQHSDHPFFLRIGYEFDSSSNNYDPEYYKLAFRHIVDRLRAAGLTNFATVYASSSVSVGEYFWQAYYPGDDYVDWIGYSYWDAPPLYQGALDFARQHNKPAMIAESSPLLTNLAQDDGEQVWERWYIPFFQHILDNSDVIKAVSYINCDWASQPMWKRSGWQDTRVQVNDVVRQKWIEVMNAPQFVNGGDDVFGLIGFIP